MVADTMVSAAVLANTLRPLALASCDGEPPHYFGSSCLNGTPMIPLHRGTVTAIYMHLERLAKKDGEETDGAQAWREHGHEVPD